MNELSALLTAAHERYCSQKAGRVIFFSSVGSPRCMRFITSVSFAARIFRAKSSLALVIRPIFQPWRWPCSSFQRAQYAPLRFSTWPMFALQPAINGGLAKGQPREFLDERYTALVHHFINGGELYPQVCCRLFRSPNLIWLLH